MLALTVNGQMEISPQGINSSVAYAYAFLRIVWLDIEHKTSSKGSRASWVLYYIYI